MDEKTQQYIDRYIHNELTESERILFKQKIEDDEVLKEEVRLQESIYHTFSEDTSIGVDNTFKNEDIKELSTLLKSDTYKNINKNIQENTVIYLEKKKTSLRRKKIYTAAMSIAAVILIFLTITPLFKSNSERLYATYENWDDIPSFVEKGINQKELVTIEDMYTSKKYDAVINAINTFSKTTLTQHPNLYIYLGSSHFHKQEYQKALIVFDTFSNSKAYDNSKGYWYKSLLFLKQGNIKEAKKVLRILTDKKGNYKYNEASKILEDIE